MSEHYIHIKLCLLGCVWVNTTIGGRRQGLGTLGKMFWEVYRKRGDRKKDSQDGKEQEK